MGGSAAELPVATITARSATSASSSDPDAALAVQPGAPAHQRDPARLDPGQLARVVQVVDHLVAAGEHRADVERPGRGLGGARDAARLGQRLRGAQQRLGGHAGVERALAADELVLDQRHVQPALGRAARGDLAGGPGAHDHHVEAPLLHGRARYSARALAVRLRRRGRRPPRTGARQAACFAAVTRPVPLGLGLLLALAGTALAPAPAPAALETIVQDDAALLHRPPDQVAVSARRLKRLGVDRVRLTANWSVLTRDPDIDAEPDFDASDPAAYDQGRWAGLDQAVRSVRAAGLAVLVDIGFWAPRWASRAPGPRARTNPNSRKYAEFAAAVARRYRGDFAVPVRDEPPAPPSQDELLLDRLLPGFGPPPVPVPLVQRPVAEPLPRVDMFALWNEPNHPGLLLPQWQRRGRGYVAASPRRYRAMVRAAYPAVKAAQPSARVLIGNTSSTGGTRGRGAVAPLEFLRGLACVNARLRPRRVPECRRFRPVPGDGWAHHPYSQNERPTRRSTALQRGDVRLADLPVLARTLDRLVAMRRLTPANRAIWLTEFGYETKRVRRRPLVTERTQARWLTWAEYVADRVSAVRSFAQFLLLDQPPAAERVSNSTARPFGQYSTGLLRADGRAKPAARTFVAGLFAQRRGADRALLYGRLRLGAGPKVIVLQQRRRGDRRWRRIGRLRIDGRQAFTRSVRWRAGTRYRLDYPGRGGGRRAGMAVEAVARTGDGSPRTGR